MRLCAHVAPRIAATAMLLRAGMGLRAARLRLAMRTVRRLARCTAAARGLLAGGLATARLGPGLLAATAAAVLNGAALIRTHDVRETLDAVRVAERLRGLAP